MLRSVVFRLRKPPPIREKSGIGGLSYSRNPPKAENFGDLSPEMMIFLRKIVSEECEKAKFSRLRRAKTVKGLKTMSKSAAGEKKLGSNFLE